MATRSFCDRCGEEIQGVPYVIKAGVKDSFDLCQSCKRKFEDYMKTETFK